MADTDNLFGSDSDDDDDFMPKACRILYKHLAVCPH